MIVPVAALVIDTLVKLPISSARIASPAVPAIVPALSTVALIEPIVLAALRRSRIAVPPVIVPLSVTEIDALDEG